MAEPLPNKSVFGRNREQDFLATMARYYRKQCWHQIYTNLILKCLNLVFDINYPIYILIINKLVYN